MKYWLFCVFLVVATQAGAMVEGPERLPDFLENPVSREKPFDRTGVARTLAEQERLAQQNQQLRSNPQLLRRIQKQPVVVVAPEGQVQGVSGTGEVQRGDLTIAQRGAIERVGASNSFVSRVSDQRTLQPTEMQKQIQRAENILVSIVKLTNKLHNHEFYEEALPLAEEQLEALVEFEEKMEKINADEVTKSGLQEKIAAVKVLLEDTIGHKNDQLAEQHAAEMRAQELLAAQKEAARQQVLQEKAQRVALQKKIQVYYADTAVQKVLDKLMTFDSVSLPDLVVDLEVLGLRDFSLEDALAQFPVGSVERVHLLEVQQFESLAFKKLEKEAPSFNTVKDTILDLIGTEGFFRRQAEEKIAFLKGQEIFNKFDDASKEYLKKIVAQFNESNDRVIALLAFSNESLVSSLEKTLSQSTQGASFNGAYNEQNELYYHLRQLEKSSITLNKILTGIGLHGEITKGTYVTLFEDFEKISGETVLTEDFSTKGEAERIAQAIKTVLSPDFALKFLDSNTGPKHVLGQQLSHSIGTYIFDVSNGPSDGHGYVLSEVQGQQVKRIYEALVKELAIGFFLEEPESWQYVPYDFLRKVGDAWLRNFAQNNSTLSDVMRFEKESILCNAWQTARGTKTNDRIYIFRQIATEFLEAGPWVRKLTLTSLDFGIVNDPFTKEQKVAASFLTANISSLDDINSDQVGKKQESIQELNNAIKGFFSFLSVKQGPAREGVGFLEDMQKALFDPSRIEQMIKQKRLPFVIKELTAFQQSVLQGKSVDDFSHEWWQVELYQRAEVFKNAVRTLDLALSDGSSETVQQAVQDFVSHTAVVLGNYKEQLVKRLWEQRLGLVGRQLEEFTSNDPVANRILFKKYPDLLENIAILIEHEKGNPYNAVVKLLQKEQARLLAYQKASEDHFYTTEQLPKLVAALRDDTKAFMEKLAPLDNAGNWKSLTSKWKKQKTLSLDDFAQMTEVMKEVKDLLLDAPELLARSADQLKNLKQYDPKNPLIKLLTNYQKQLSKNQKLYRSYVKTWQGMLDKENIRPFDEHPFLSLPGTYTEMAV